MQESQLLLWIWNPSKIKERTKQPFREDLSDRLADFEARQGQDLSEKLKEYKDTSRRWIEMGPEVTKC